MAEEKNILIVCGEPSGDLNAANLVSAVRQIAPQIKFSGVGGELLRRAGVNICRGIKDLAVLGLFDALKKLPSFFALKDFLLKKIEDEKPDALILVDFSGFNLRLAKAVNNRLPVIYYTSPQVWASRRGRLSTIKKYISRMLVFFKFEQEFYKKHGIAVDFVGHPLLDIPEPPLTAKSETAKTAIALLPGSRKAEVKNILPVMLGAAEIIRRHLPGGAQFIIAKSPQVEMSIYNRITAKFKEIEPEFMEGKTYECLRAADFALVASGTATLEAAIMQKPFLVIYRLGLLNYLLYLPQVRVPYIGMANIVAGKKAVPEFIQYAATPAGIASETLSILQDPNRLGQMKNDLAKVKSALGEPGAASRAAKIILDSI